MYLEKVWEDFTANNFKKEGLNGYAYNFIVASGIIDNSNFINIHRYLMKKAWYKIKFGFIKKMFISELLSSRGSLTTKYFS